MKQIQRTDVSLAQTPEPYYIPGYTGYCPRFIYRCGDTYGTLTHFLLLDPCANHGQKLVVSNRSCSDYEVERPTLTELDLVKKREERIDSVYKHPLVPGYECFVPRVRGRFGHRFSVTATEGISEFERNYLKKRCEERKLKTRGALELNETSGRSIGERSLQTTDYKFPLEAVRPEAAGLIKEIERKDLPIPPVLPYSSQEGIEKGTRVMCLKPNRTLQRKSWFDDYNQRQSTEWEPILAKGIGIKAPSNDEQFRIYFEDRGLIPGYKGHVPGLNHKYGKTYGKSSIDAKRATYCECH